MRRLIIDEPYSRAAVWSSRFAVFALAVVATAFGMSRIKGVETPVVLSVFGGALVFAGLAGLCALIAFVTIWRRGLKGVGLAVKGALLAAALLSFPAFLVLRATQLPMLNDVTTDPVDPPAFSRSSTALAARGGLMHDDPGPAARELQRRFYPGLQPVLVDLDAAEVHALVLKTIAALHWRLVESRKPGGRMGMGFVEATDRTLFLNIPDDVAIRIRPLAGQTRIDLRSASRYGVHDLGVNAKRIRAFVEELQNQISAR